MADPTPTTDQTDPPALSVHQAIAAVMAEQDGVGKTSQAPEKAGGYMYRGIEAVTATLRRLCGKHGVVIYPVTNLMNVQPAVGMNPGWTDSLLTVTWGVIGPDGSRLTPDPITYGLGRDNTDKGINKAMTQAYKYLLLQLFMVADDAHDADGADYSRGVQTEAEAGVRLISRPDFDDIAGQVKALSSTAREHLARQWLAEDPMTGERYLPADEAGKPSLARVTANEVPAVRALLAEAKRHASRTDSDAGEGAQEPQDGPEADPAADTAGEPSAATEADGEADG